MLYFCFILLNFPVTGGKRGNEGQKPKKTAAINFCSVVFLNISLTRYENFSLLGISGAIKFGGQICPHCSFLVLGPGFDP